MRVGFDTSPLHHPFSPGVARVAERLLEALEERAVLDVVRLAPEPGVPLRRWRYRELPKKVGELDLVGLHSFGSGFPWRGPGRRVQTVHEVPWRHGANENVDLRHRLWVGLGPVLADRVVCPSEHVKRDLSKRLLPGASKVRVVPWGVASPFASEPPLGVVDESVLEELRIGDDGIVLCVGAVREKKNLAAVLRGLAALRDRERTTLQLVVTGAESADLRRDLGLASQVGLARWISTVGVVSDAELASLLRLSSVVPVLSRSEGFALPALEAMACGVPVLVPAGSAQAELCAEQGIVVEPDSAESVADGLERAIAEGRRRRAGLLERAAAFSWHESARRIEELWGELA